MSRKVSFLLVLCLCSVPLLFIPKVISQSPPQPVFNWSEVAFAYHLDRVWTGDSFIINYSGSYSDVFHTNDHIFNYTENTYTRILRDITYYANYSYFSNTTRQGDFSIDMALDIYRVNINYGTGAKLVWFALKKGAIQMDYNIDSYFKNYSYYEEYQEDIVDKCTKFNRTTGEVIDEWQDSYQNFDTRIMNPDPIQYSEGYEVDIEFTIPLILTMQMYTTENQDKIAWAEQFCEYILYKDKDKDMIYSAGETSDPSQSGFTLYQSDEYIGFIEPMAFWGTVYQEYDSWNDTFEYSFPVDKAPAELASNIVFTPPSFTDTNIVSWNIEYPAYPIRAQVVDWDKLVEEWYFTQCNANYSDTSPGDFDYGFVYNVSENQANLDFTLGLSKISNATLYNAVQGYGLCIPHYNYFLASFDINEIDPKELTVPSSVFTFETNNITVATIDMVNPIKKNYTLFDYPETGINTELESFGGSIHKLLSTDAKLSANTLSPFINLIYSIEDLVAEDTNFIVVDDLYAIETQSYPIWNGEKLVHDPTLTIYFIEQETNNDLEEGIPGFSLYTMLVSSLFFVIIYTVKSKRKSIKCEDGGTF